MEFAKRMERLETGIFSKLAEVKARRLAEGKSVMLDRYVYSNVAYQCAKVVDPQARRKLRDWIVDLEYCHHAIPVPDLSLFLDVPFGFTKRKLEEVREGDDREYLQGKRDIHESSLILQQRVREVYLEQEALDDRFRVIDCSAPDGSMLDPDSIFERIARQVDRMLPLPEGKR